MTSGLCWLVFLGCYFLMDIRKLLWPFRPTGGRPGHVNAIVMTLIILLIVRVMTMTKVVLKL